MPENGAVSRYSLHACLIAFDRTTMKSSVLVEDPIVSADMKPHFHLVNLATPYVVDNVKSQVSLTICMDQGAFFHGARITYSYSNAGNRAYDRQHAPAPATGAGVAHVVATPARASRHDAGSLPRQLR